VFPTYQNLVLYQLHILSYIYIISLPPFSWFSMSSGYRLTAVVHGRGFESHKRKEYVLVRHLKELHLKNVRLSLKTIKSRMNLELSLSVLYIQFGLVRIRISLKLPAEWCTEISQSSIVRSIFKKYYLGKKINNIYMYVIRDIEK
jgi:hypothetical protein